MRGFREHSQKKMGVCLRETEMDHRRRRWKKVKDRQEVEKCCQKGQYTTKKKIKGKKNKERQTRAVKQKKT